MDRAPYANPLPTLLHPLPLSLREPRRELWENTSILPRSPYETHDNLLDFKTSLCRKGPHVVYRAIEILYPWVFLSPRGEKNPSEADTWTEITKKKLAGLV